MYIEMNKCVENFQHKSFLDIKDEMQGSAEIMCRIIAVRGGPDKGRY